MFASSAVSIYLGVRLPEKPYERVELKDVSMNRKIVDLKNEAEKLLTFPQEQLEFIYCGRILDDPNTLTDEGVNSGSTIHVFQKQIEADESEPALTEAEIEEAVSAYRNAPKSVPGFSFAKAVRPEVIEKVLHRYPEFYKNIGAFAVLKDAILLERMVKFPTAIATAEFYPILIRSAKFVAETMVTYLKSANASVAAPLIPIEELSDSSSASENESPLASPNLSDNIRQISRGQLVAALMYAGSASLNSLSNISQRNATDMPAVVAGEAPAATSSTNRISNTNFSNALSQALGAAASSPQAGSSTSQSDGAEQQRQQVEQQRQLYVKELQTLREMGLMDEAANLRALFVCNGDVEAAINFVLAESGNFT